MDKFDGVSYEKNSQIQKSQSEILFEMIPEFKPENILDVGCGNGEITNKLSNKFNATVYGVDSSKSQIEQSRKKYEQKFYHSNILDFTPKEKFDLIFSNAALHWILNQIKLYRKLNSMLSEEGYIAVHQGGSGSYSELHAIAYKTLIERSFEKVEDLEVTLKYHTPETIKETLEKTGFNLIKIREDKRSETIDQNLAKAFAEASLLPYREVVENEEDYKNEFIDRSIGRSTNINRIYFIAELKQ